MSKVNTLLASLGFTALCLVLAPTASHAQFTCDSAALGEDDDGAEAGIDGVACGTDAVAFDQGTAVGSDADATGNGATAVGQGSEADANNAVAIGRASNALENNGVAVGSFTNVEGANAVGVGFGANAEGNDSAAIGQFANAGGNASVAIGSQASSAADSATAVGANTSAGFENSAAFGFGAAAARANQQVFGTSSNTYTMSGIASDASRAAQGAPTHIVTSNANGDLAAFSADELGLASKDELNEGLAVAMAMSGLTLPSDKTFAIGANIGFFENKQAISAQGALRLDDTYAVNAGIGISGSNASSIGGRVGIMGAW